MAMTPKQLREELRAGGMHPDEFSLLMKCAGGRNVAYHTKVSRRTEIIAKLIGQIGARGIWRLLGEERPRVEVRCPAGMARPRSEEARARVRARARAVREEIRSQAE